MTAAPMPARERQPFDRRALKGPFDIIGDVHGCAQELIELLGKLGYEASLSGKGGSRIALTRAPQSRKAIFVGDLVDRGPASPDVLRIVMAMVESGQALAVPGNHDIKFLRWLSGKQVKLAHGLERTVAQLEGAAPQFMEDITVFLETIPFYLWLDEGALAVAHAGIKAPMLGRLTGEIRSFCLYGETSGETDEFGLPVRYHWAAEHAAQPAIVYGHTPVPEATWVNNTLCLDTGCAFGGRLSALRWPEREIVSVPARDTYVKAVRPFGHPPVKPR